MSWTRGPMRRKTETKVGASCRDCPWQWGGGAGAICDSIRRASQHAREHDHRTSWSVYRTGQIWIGGKEP